MSDRNNRLSHAPIIISPYHIDSDSPMVQKRITIGVGRTCLERDHFIVIQVLYLMLMVNTILGFMSNTVGVIRALLIRCVQPGAGVHRLRPH